MAGRRSGIGRAGPGQREGVGLAEGEGEGGSRRTCKDVGADLPGEGSDDSW